MCHRRNFHSILRKGDGYFTNYMLMMIITGGSGKLGGALKKVFPDTLFPTHAELDVCDKGTIEAYLRVRTPDVFIHAAAYTNVRKAEREERQKCWDANVKGTENIVSLLARHAPACRFVYISTACVFYGDRGNYTEEDVPYPKNFYGVTKLMGEAIAWRAPDALVVRTNFVAREPWPYPKAFTDRFGTYLFADDVAKGIRDVVEKKLAGTVHVRGAEKLSMFDLARITTPDVEPMTMVDLVDPVPLTMDMSLESVRIPPYPISRE